MAKAAARSAVAYEPSRLVHIDRDRLLAFLKQRPDALLRIVQLLCARMRRVTHLGEDLIFLDVSTRLARQIVALTDARVPHHEHAATATLHLSQNDLARMLGVSREFVGERLTALAGIRASSSLAADGSPFATPGRSNACARASARPAGRAGRDYLAKCERVRRRRP